MTFEFTAIFEPQPDGWIVGTIAEVPGAFTQGRTMDEVRANLAEVLQLMWETQRENTLAETEGAPQLERFAVQIPGLPCSAATCSGTWNNTAAGSAAKGATTQSTRTPPTGGPPRSPGTPRFPT
jgi:predicted RNase H-like HicB family nuclease